jgi:hypothetical protein
MKLLNLLFVFIFISCNPLALVEDEEIGANFFKGNNPCATNSTADKYDDIGEGTDESPYWICNADQLNDLSMNCSNTFGSDEACYAIFSQGKDIDMDGINFEPIGDTVYNFQGVYQGYGYFIWNLYIDNANDYQGFFGVLGYDGEVIGLNIVDAYVAGTDFIGIVVGENLGGSIEEMMVSGYVASSNGDVGGVAGNSNTTSGIIADIDADIVVNHSGTNPNVGGIVGSADHPIEFIKVRGEIETSANSQVGGVVGYMGGSGSLDTIYADVSIDATNGSVVGVGGIAGVLNYSMATKVAADGYIESANAAVATLGGLFGRVDGASIDQCGFGGTIVTQSTTTTVGGIVGSSNDLTTNIYINNCYSHADIYGGGAGGSFGGILGEVPSNDNFYIDSVYSTTHFFDATTNIGGIVAIENGVANISNAFFDSGADGSPSATLGGTGVSDSALQTASTFSSFNSSKWTKTNGDYPYLTKLLEFVYAD